MKPLSVLIADDQPAVIKALEVLLDLNGIPHVAATTAEQALDLVCSEPLAAVIQDMNFTPNTTSGEEGIELFRAIRSTDPGLPILLMTAWASLSSAVDLIKEGASDYIEKPWDDDRLLVSLSNLMRMRELEVENVRLRAEVAQSRQELEASHDLRGLVYRSAAMHRVVSLALTVAGSDAPVLITGASGSGKERLAEIVQANSSRAAGPFVTVNVGAIPEQLMESELFGAEAGAYTGIAARRIGHFESADRGTLFLDEIDALSLSGQVKLLRALQSGEFRRLGSSRARRADVRLISATNTDLNAAIADARFREDLFYRINVVELQLPDLSARPQDILPLARHFLDLLASLDGRSFGLDPGAEQRLVEHSWPGNVRELENRVHRATLTASTGGITAADLGLDGEHEAAGPVLAAADVNERAEIIEVLSSVEGVVSRAARELGISRQALYRRMSRLGIKVERRPRGGSTGGP